MRTQNDSDLRNRRDVQNKFESLPDIALIKAAEVCRLGGFSMAVLDRRVRSGDWPTPCYNGRDRCWQWGEVKKALLAIAEQKRPTMPANPPRQMPRRTVRG